MKVGFLSIDAAYVDRREAQIALFDHSMSIVNTAVRIKYTLAG